MSEHADEEEQERLPLAGRQHEPQEQEVGGDSTSSSVEFQRDVDSEVARQEGHGAQEGLSRPTCTSCWMDSHHCVDNRRCACWVCRTEEEINMLGMAHDTVNRDTQEWDRIEAAVAFRLPSGDELLIARKVPCPTCGKPVAMVLADNTTIGYSRRHSACGLEKIELGEEQDNG